jgi:hypothetical protein
VTDPTKPYQITFSERPGYLYANLQGDKISVEIIRDYIADIVEKSNETGLRKILLYRDVPVVLSDGEVFRTVNDSLRALSGKQLALVNPHEDIHAIIEFGVTVAQNRGGNYRSFANVAEAEAWLLK